MDKMFLHIFFVSLPSLCSVDCATHISFFAPLFPSKAAAATVVTQHFNITVSSQHFHFSFVSLSFFVRLLTNNLKIDLYFEGVREKELDGTGFCGSARGD